MATRVTPGKAMTVAAIALLAAAVLLVWVIAGSRANDQDGGTSLETRILDAAAGDTARVGDCFGHGHGTIAGPDPERLARLVDDKGRNARLEAGTEAAPDARTLAERTGGELIATEGDEAYVLYVTDGPRRVTTYSQFRSSNGDTVWLTTGSTRKISCDKTGD
jgi:hypothetical protein